MRICKNLKNSKVRLLVYLLLEGRISYHSLTMNQSYGKEETISESNSTRSFESDRSVGYTAEGKTLSGENANCIAILTIEINTEL